MRHLPNYPLLIFTGLLLSACDKSESIGLETTEIVPNNAQEVQDYYTSKPEFFSFKTLNDIPTDLDWQDGMYLPELGSDQALKGGTEYNQIQDFPRTLRTAGPDSNGSFRHWILDDVAMSLAHLHPDEFEFYPGLAERWAVDNKNKTVYAKLNQNARWSDGKPVTVDDYLFMFFMFQSDYIVDPWYKETYSTQYANITKYDDLTFSISLTETKPDLDHHVLGLGPLPAHFYSELGDDFVERYQWRFQPTTGAYIIKPEDIKKGISITLTRHQDWWAKDNKFWKNRYNLDKVRLTVMRDTAKVFEAFKKGKIDQHGLNLAEFWYDKLPDTDPDVANGYIQKSVFYNQKPRPNWGLWINSARPLLDNQNIRVGINYATNWQLVINRFFRGDYVRAHSQSPGFGKFSHPTLKARDFDIDKALEHFALAGFIERNSDGILINAAGQKLSFSLSTSYEQLKDVMTILKEEALKAGLDLRVEVLGNTTGFKKVMEKQHDIGFMAFGSPLQKYPGFWSFLHSYHAYDKAFLTDGSINPERKIKRQTTNLESIAIFELDQMIDQYRASSDEAKKLELAQKIIELHHDYASFVPAYYQPSYRIGHWRWIRYPEFFNHKHSATAGELHVHWLDPVIRDKTLAAQKAGLSMPAAINVYDQFR